MSRTCLGPYEFSNSAASTLPQPLCVLTTLLDKATGCKLYSDLMLQKPQCANKPDTAEAYTCDKQHMQRSWCRHDLCAIPTSASSPLSLSLSLASSLHAVNAEMGQCMAAAPQSSASCLTSSSQPVLPAPSLPCRTPWTTTGSPHTRPATRSRCPPG